MAEWGNPHKILIKNLRVGGEKLGTTVNLKHTLFFILGLKEQSAQGLQCLLSYYM